MMSERTVDSRIRFVNARPLRVLVYSVINPHDAGGAQKVINRLLQSLRRRGHLVMEARSGSQHVSAEGGWICPLYLRPHRSRPYHLPSLWRAAMGLVRRRPDIVNVQMVTNQSKYFLMMAPLFGYKTVISAHGSDILKPDEDSRRYLGEIFREADAVTVVSDHLREKVLAYPHVQPEKVHVIPNGIDCRFWSPAPAPTDHGGDAPVVVALGRLEHVKGFDVLLKAFSAVRNAVPKAKLCIIGEGTLTGDLERQARELGLADAVELPGHLEESGVRERLRAAAVFALSSRSEGMPLSLLEAMAVGLPVVATRVGGVPEVVTAETGALISPEAPGEMAEALIRLLKNPDLRERLARGARERAELYSDSLSDDAYERIFESLVGR